jgi:hypothetical protein
MWLGVALGVGFVTVIALNDEGCDSDPGFCTSAWAYTPFFAVSGAFTGGAVGAILGSHVKGWRTQKW